MDLSQPIWYRNLNINGAILGSGRVIRGIAVDQADYSTISVTGFTEKRAGADGMHASDVYLGGRQVDLQGHVYGSNLADLFDWLHTLRSVFSPTSAYQDSPGDKGFLPLSYTQETNDTDSFPLVPGSVGPPVVPAIPAGTVPLFMNVRPLRPPHFTINASRQTNERDEKPRPTGTPWAVSLLAKDPRVYVNPEQVVDISGALNTPGGTATVAKNRGDYETPFNVMLVIGPTVPAVGSFRVKGLNNVDLTIKIEAKANVIYRWFGDDRVLMTQDNTDGTQSAPFILRMDLVSFATLNRRPMVPAAINPPARPFTTPFTYWKSVALAAGSRLFWSEAFA